MFLSADADGMIIASKTTLTVGSFSYCPLSGIVSGLGRTKIIQPVSTLPVVLSSFCKPHRRKRLVHCWFNLHFSDYRWFETLVKKQQKYAVQAT